MFNPNKPVYMIGVDEGGGYNHTSSQLAHLGQELEQPKVKPIHIQLPNGHGRWTVGNGSELTIDLNSATYQPVVKEGESFTIKVLELVIECKMIRGLYAITSIMVAGGGIANTMQLDPTSKFAAMLRVTTLSPVVDIFK